MRPTLFIRIRDLRWFMCALLLVSASPSHAQHMNEPGGPCADVSVTTELVDCLSKAKGAAESDLNVTYQNIRKKLPRNDADRLAATQRAWITYRDQNCSAERALYDGGTGAYPAYLACLEAMTKSRIKELKTTYVVSKLPLS